LLIFCIKPCLFFLLFSIYITIPIVCRPNIGQGLDDQSNISLTLFNTILEATRSQTKLHQSWEVISQDIRIREQWKAQQRLAINQPPR
jgi:hypothetical protein